MPVEQCDVLPGQLSTKKLTANQTQQMIKFAVRKPADNARLIVDEGVRTMGLGQNVTDGPKKFGLNVIPSMVTVNGRILSPPELTYGANKRSTPRSGAWNMAGSRFFSGATISKWTAIKFSYPNRESLPQGQTIAGAMQSLAAAMSAAGLRVSPSVNPQGSNFILRQNDDDNQREVFNTAFQQAVDKNVEMVMVILPEKSASLYANCKYVADVQKGIHTICCQGDKLKLGDNIQYLANVALKWNLKRGGVNHVMANDKLPVVSAGKTMLLGMDVTHPSPGSSANAPSVAGVAASIKADCAQWPATVRSQRGGTEMIEAVEDMVASRLRLWAKHNANVYPANIILYRDGVSEGQYQQVLEKEVPAIEAAAKKLYSPKVGKVKITVVVCGKRHHTRFYPTTQQDADRSNNPPSGTIVDRGVTSEKDWDFFLQAHSGLQGTAKPAHYIVIRDDIKLGAQQLETLVSSCLLSFSIVSLTESASQTHNLCYLFGRATKAISLCPPAYYADLVCERARCYFHDMFNDDAESRTSDGSGGLSARWTGDVHKNLKDTMFYI